MQAIYAGHTRIRTILGDPRNDIVLNEHIKSRSWRLAFVSIHHDPCVARSIRGNDSIIHDRTVSDSIKCNAVIGVSDNHIVVDPHLIPFTIEYSYTLKGIDRQRQVRIDLGNDSISVNGHIRVEKGKVIVIPTLDAVAMNALIITNIVPIGYAVVLDTNMATIVLYAISGEVIDCVAAHEEIFPPVIGLVAAKINSVKNILNMIIGDGYTR